MSLIQGKCKNCGSNLEIDDSNEKATCPVCGTPYYMEKPPITVNINNINIGKNDGPDMNRESVSSFSLMDYAIRFEKDERQAKQDWLSQLISYEDAPLDVAYNSKIISITKEYYPVAFFDITAMAYWKALSYWEHQEPYQVVEKHRTLSGEVEHRVVTKYNTIVDNVQQTNGEIPPTLYQVKVWMGSNEGSPVSSAILNWIDLDSNYVNVENGYLNDYTVIPTAWNKEIATKNAEDIAHESIHSVCGDNVPGDRYENLQIASHIDKTHVTTRYAAVYHIKYEYAGKEFEYYTTGASNNSCYIEDHPTNAAIKQKVDNIKKKVSSLNKTKWLWLLGIIGSPLLGFFFLMMVLAGGITSGYGYIAIIGAVLALATAVFLGISIFKFINANKRVRAAQSIQKAFNEKNSGLKQRICELIQDDSIPDETKGATIQKWISEIGFGNEEEAIDNISVGKANVSKIIKFACIGIGGALVLGLGGFGLAAVLGGSPEKEASKAVENFMKAAKSYDVIKMNMYLSSDCNDKKGLMKFMSTEDMIEGVLAFDNVTSKQISDESKESLSKSTEKICKNFIVSYESLTVKNNKDGTYTIKVPARILNMNGFNTKYRENHRVIENDLSNKYAADVQKIVQSSSSDAEALEKLFDLVMPDICNAVEDSVENAGDYKVTFSFTVEKISGKYKISKIDYL